MTYAKLKEIANEALIKQLFELTNLSLETDYLWFFHCPTKQKICTDTKAKPDYKNSITYVNNKLKSDCNQISEPSYFLINQNGIKSVKDESVGLELAFLFPLATSNNDPFIMVTHKEIEVYQLEEIKKETKKILGFLNVVINSFPEITTKPTSTNTIRSIMIQGDFYNLTHCQLNNYTYIWA
ncbi:MAG: hypothetical protein PF517_05985 [Salinivirgaceae bacterium]|jgi:hypothetical protein|nr:hypothetical protein [Salinivirgaceae bacterium]